MNKSKLCITSLVGAIYRLGVPVERWMRWPELGVPPSPPSPPTVTVEFGGRVVDADTGGPVANVRVSVFG